MNCHTGERSKEMNWAINRYGKRILAVCGVIVLVLLQFVFVVPVMHADAEPKAGLELEVRVQYEGERSGKIRTAAVFSNHELESMGAHNQMFSNITRVGTVMHSAAYGVDLENIIAAAGIDLGSVKSFTFRATDGYTISFYGDDYLGATGWYYPELSRMSNRVNIGNGDGVLQMKAGALDGGVLEKSSLLAIKSYSRKGSNIDPRFDQMTTEESYRFFTGQTDLSYLRYEDEEGNEAFLPTTENDISAWDSVKYIYGIDIVLKGSPPLDGISLDVLGDNMKVGSQVQVQVTFEGDVLGIFNMSDVTWSSSDESIATVDKDGLVTILQEKEVTITAEAGGHSAYVVINGGNKGAGNKNQAGQDNKNEAKAEDSKDTVKAKTKPTRAGTTNSTKPKANAKENPKAEDKTKNQTIMAREISIGDEIKPEPVESEAAVSVNSDAQALEEAEAYDKKIVAGSTAAALLACSGGAVFRIRRFKIDLGQNLKGKQ